MSVNSSEGTRFGLSGNALKLIAIIAMTVDHLAWMGIETYSQAETPLLIFLHVIGRLTAPIMLFFVAEGYSHTHNFRKYLGRMAQLSVISHFAFCYFNGSGFNPLTNRIFNATSIAWPLTWGLILLKVWVTEQWGVPLKVLITLIGCVVTFTSDWSFAAPLAILMMGRSKGNFHKQMLWLMLFCVAVCCRVLHREQSCLRYSPSGLLVHGPATVSLQRSAGKMAVAGKALLLVLPCPHGIDRHNLSHLAELTADLFAGATLYSLCRG